MSSSTCPECGGLTGVHAQKVVNTMQQMGLDAYLCLGHPTSSARDTQFAGFAKKVVEELTEVHDGCFQSGCDWWREQVEQIVARRAYDLIAHSLDFAFTKNIVFGTPEEATEQIPDLTKWGKKP